MPLSMMRFSIGIQNMCGWLFSLQIVIVCEPEQASLMMGGLHPRGSLYERPINIDSAKHMHSDFRTVSGCCTPGH